MPRVGLISGNPANILLETGTPLKGREGWVKRWYRITAEDAQAYRDACGDRISQLHGEQRSFPSEAARRQYHMEEMSKFRNEWLKSFLKNRKY